MKRFYFILPLLLLVLSAPAFAQSFEGVIEMGVTVAQLGPQELPVTISVKQEKLRISLDMPNMGELTIYNDPVAKKLTTVMAAMNMGFEMPIPAADTAVVNMPAAVATGQTKTIGSYSCDEFSCIAEDSMVINIWMTRDLPGTISSSLFQAIENSTQGIVGTDGFRQLAAQGYIPVQTVVKKDGVDFATVMLKNFEQKSLDDALFVIPANITIQQMPSGMMGR